MSVSYAIFFGILGPIFGGVVLMSIIMPLEFGTKMNSGLAHHLQVFFMGVAMGFFTAPVALVMGIVPAAFTGVAYRWIKSQTTLARLPRIARAAIISIVGGVACVLFYACFSIPVSEMFSRETFDFIVLPGMAAAAICAVLADRREGRLPPEHVQPTSEARRG
jgi:hypothetical protein